MLRDRHRHRARVVEAMILLAFARLLVQSVRFGIWRCWIGRIGDGNAAPAAPAAHPRDTTTADLVTRAVRRACHRRQYRCLPRAIATQWMLRRRGVPSSLMFGVAPPSEEKVKRSLHAWVQVGSQTVIGADSSRSHRLALALTQADPRR